MRLGFDEKFELWWGIPAANEMQRKPLDGRHWSAPEEAEKAEKEEEEKEEAEEEKEAGEGRE